MRIEAAHRPGGLDLHLWYPARDDAPVTLIGQNALFYGFHARRDAMADGAMLPVVVLSHGSGGNAEQMGWLATDLAARGFIVAAVNHPGTTSRDSLPARTVMPWERTADVTAVLDRLAGEAVLGLRPDMSRVGVIGFSLGGATALLVAGARLSKADFITYCTDLTGKADCEWLSQGGVDFNGIDAARYEADLRDPRVKAAVAVDPALSHAMTPDSLGKVAVPVRIVNLGSPGAVPAAMQADDAAAQIPGASYRTVEGAAHFSFLPRCSWFGVFVIGLAGDDNICSDWSLRDRDVIHAELAEDISRYLQGALLPMVD